MPKLDPREVRRIYDEETEATPAEVAETLREVATDPNAARDYILVVAAMAPTDPQFAIAWAAFRNRLGVSDQQLAVGLEDDAIALEWGGVLRGVVEELKPGSLPPSRPAPRVHTGGRGRPKKPRSV